MKGSLSRTFDFRRWHDKQAAFVIPLRSLVALCRLGFGVSVEGSGVAEACSDLSEPWSFPSTTEGDVCGGVGSGVRVCRNCVCGEEAASNSEHGFGELSWDGEVDIDVERTLARRGLKRIGWSRNLAISILLPKPGDDGVARRA